MNREVIEYENLKGLNKSFFEGFTKKFNEVLNSGWYILGKQVEEFEYAFAKYNGAKHCIGVASGLDAIYLSLKACDFPKDSEVIVPANTYIASILPILELGLKPILIEPNLRTYNIDHKRIEEKITSKTVAIEVVHLYGKCCQMDEIIRIKEKYGLVLIEDCAQAHGAMFNQRKAGTFGEFGAFSFYPTKNLGALGDAGAILTDDSNYFEKLCYLRNYGSKVKYENKYLGNNSRLDELQAAFLNFKLGFLDQINEHKRHLAKKYQESISQSFAKPIFQDGFYDVFHIYNIRHPQRDKLREFLLGNGVKTEIHYPIPPHRQKALVNLLGSYNLPISEEIHQTTLSLPISYCHDEEDIKYVCQIIDNFE